MSKNIVKSFNFGKPGTEEASESEKGEDRPVDVLAAGRNIVDVSLRLPDEVRRGEKNEIRDLVIQGGAPVGNAACVISSLGWRTGFISYFGNNLLSALARAEFARCGVVENFFLHDPSACPGVAVVESNPQNGERTIFYSLANYHHLSAADVPTDAVMRVPLILVDGYETEAALKMLEAAAGPVCRSVIDIEAGEPDTLRRIISLATDAILPLATGRHLTGRTHPAEVLKELCQWTEGQVIVTDGELGSWAAIDGGMLHQPAIRVNPVDTTGCGDAYHGAYASALLDGFPLHLRMEFAAWVASRVALHLGGRSGLPTLKSLREESRACISNELGCSLDKTSRWKSPQGGLQ